MDVICIAGSYPRHQYLARKLDSLGYLSGVVIQDRGDPTPDPPSGLEGTELRNLYRHHFRRRREAEEDFFINNRTPAVPSVEVTGEELNSEKVWDFVEEIDADLALTYGVGYLNERSLNCLPEAAWNVHPGHTPMYKGKIAHFWPSYLLEPQMTVVSLHELTESIDEGQIVHQGEASLVRGDGIHDLSCRSIKQFIDNDLQGVLRLFRQNGLADPEEQAKSGKFWYSEDWRPEHLITIYEKYNNSIVDMCLDGEIQGREPTLYQQPIDVNQ